MQQTKHRVNKYVMEDSGVTPEVLFKNESKFYQDADDYWSQVEPTVNGMLGGFGNISSIDIQGSDLFLKKLFNVSISSVGSFQIDLFICSRFTSGERNIFTLPTSVLFKWDGCHVTSL